MTRVGIQFASEEFWVNLLELRNGQEKLSDTFRRWQPWVNDQALRVTSFIQVLRQVCERVTPSRGQSAVVHSVSRGRGFSSLISKQWLKAI